MAFNFKSVGHFFAVVAEKVLAVGTKLETTESTVETVSAAVPVYGPLAVPVEKAGYAVLGELMSVINAGGEAAKSKLADAGLDINVITTVEAILKGAGSFAALAKSL
jgi:hypothetical protein